MLKIRFQVPHPSCLPCCLSPEEHQCGAFPGLPSAVLSTGQQRLGKGELVTPGLAAEAGQGLITDASLPGKLLWRIWWCPSAGEEASPPPPQCLLISQFQLPPGLLLAHFLPMLGAVLRPGELRSLSIRGVLQRTSQAKSWQRHLLFMPHKQPLRVAKAGGGRRGQEKSDAAGGSSQPPHHWGWGLSTRQ